MDGEETTRSLWYLIPRACMPRDFEMVPRAGRTADYLGVVRISPSSTFIAARANSYAGVCPFLFDRTINPEHVRPAPHDTLHAHPFAARRRLREAWELTATGAFPLDRSSGPTVHSERLRSSNPSAIERGQDRPEAPIPPYTNRRSDLGAIAGDLVASGSSGRTILHPVARRGCDWMPCRII